MTLMRTSTATRAFTNKRNDEHKTSATDLVYVNSRLSFRCLLSDSTAQFAAPFSLS